ncbi:unnamed protein product, partial [Ectocarpus fasciculatus]
MLFISPTHVRYRSGDRHPILHLHLKRGLEEAAILMCRKLLSWVSLRSLFTFTYLPRNCGELSGKVTRPCRSVYGFKQASRTWHKNLVSVMNPLGFEQCPSDNGVMRLVTYG